MEPTEEIPYKKVGKYYFNDIAPIGKGAFGTVYIAYDLTNKDAKLAVKAIKIVDLLDDDIEREAILREIQVLRQIKGDHVVQLVDVCRTVNHLYIFMEYCEGGDLDSKIKNGEKFSEEKAYVIIKQIAKAFVDLDKLEVNSSGEGQISLMHRDIKPANILYKNGKVKLGDFGFAKIIDKIDEDIRQRHTLAGSPLYSPPQILKGKMFNAKCDVWSAGVVFYMLIYNRPPWNATTVEELIQNISSQPLKFPDTVNTKAETRDLIQKMLQIEEDRRASWKEVYEHPALKNCHF